eukprot:5190315-Prymnesium_polylepis.1
MDHVQVIAIDSMVSCFAIDEPAARTLFDAFCGRVSELVSSASAQPDVPQPAFEAVRALVRRPRHTRTKARRRRCTTPSRCRPGVGATCVAPCARARGARRVCMRLTRAACTAPADIVCVRCLLKGRGDESSEAYCPPLHYDIGVEGCAELQAGFLETLPQIGALPPEAFATLPSLIVSFAGAGSGEGK